MTDAWFSPETARLFSFLSLLSLCSLFAIPASSGRLRGLAVGVWTAVIGLGVLLLAGGGIALAAGQPEHVSRALLLSGLLTGLIFAATLPGLLRGYSQAELRRTVAADL